MRLWRFRQPAERPPSPAPRDLRRRRAVDALHVFVLSSFAIAQPVYDHLGERAAFLLNSGIGLNAVLVLIALVSLGLPALLVGAERAAGLLGRSAYDAAHALVVFVLLALLLIPICKREAVVSFVVAPFSTFEDAPAVLVAIVLTLAGAVLLSWAAVRLRLFRMFLTLMTPGIVVFPAVMIFHSSLTGILYTPPLIVTDRFNPVPVVLLVFDEFCGASLMNEDREVDAVRFPNFARLAERSTWFRNATTVHVDTYQAVPAILSGRYPATSWEPTPPDLPQNLFSVLESTGGYEMAVFEPVSSLAPWKRAAEDVGVRTLPNQLTGLSKALWLVYLHHVTPKQLWPRLPEIPRLWFGLRANPEIDLAQQRGVFRYKWGDVRELQFEHFLDCIDGEPEPALHFMHILLPHVPWCYLPTSHRYSADVDSFDLLNFNSHNELMNYWSNDEAIVIQSQQRYLLQLEYVDRQIGRLIDRLEEAGLYDECLLIVTADHGVSFRAGQARRQATPETMADVLSVPLFVKRPGQAEGETSDLHAETIDVFPTITDVLGIQLRHPVDGRSVFDESQPDREQKFYSHLLTKVPVDVKVIVETDLPKMLRERFGDPRDPRALFRVGPVPELVGRRVDSLPLVAEPQGRLELVRYGDEASEGQDAYVPCFFEGYVRAPKVAEQPQLVAVAVNGVIGAVTRTYLLEEMKERWGTLVAEDLFHPGKNDVRFYLVTPAPGTGGWRLSPCEFRLIPEPPPF